MKTPKKNQKGFSHHILLPVLAILLVSGIGGYVMLRSSSAATKGWTTVLSKKTYSFSKKRNGRDATLDYSIKMCKYKALNGKYVVKSKITVTNVMLGAGETPFTVRAYAYGNAEGSYGQPAYLKAGRTYSVGSAAAYDKDSVAYTNLAIAKGGGATNPAAKVVSKLPTCP